MTANDLPPRPVTPQDPPRAHPADDSHTAAGSPQPPKRTVGVYDRPERSWGGRALTIASIVGVLIVLFLLWVLGVFSS